jgi:hypothetical protein
MPGYRVIADQVTMLTTDPKRMGIGLYETPNEIRFRRTFEFQIFPELKVFIVHPNTTTPGADVNITIGGLYETLYFAFTDGIRFVFDMTQ